MNIFGWMNDQLLRMQWLSDLVASGVQALGLDPASRIGGSVQFFLYDVVKIFILLSVLIFAISYVQSYFPPERTRRILGGRSGIGANILGALLGTITPFCSCSSIPLFIGFTAAGLPLGVTFSFLISSPLVDMASVILLASIFSWPIALAYVLMTGDFVVGAPTIWGKLQGLFGLNDLVALAVPVPTQAINEGIDRHSKTQVSDALTAYRATCMDRLRSLIERELMNDFSVEIERVLGEVGPLLSEIRSALATLELEAP